MGAAGCTALASDHDKSRTSSTLQDRKDWEAFLCRRIGFATNLVMKAIESPVSLQARLAVSIILTTKLKTICSPFLVARSTALDFSIMQSSVIFRKPNRRPSL